MQTKFPTLFFHVSQNVSWIFFSLSPKMSVKFLLKKINNVKIMMQIYSLHSFSFSLNLHNYWLWLQIAWKNLSQDSFWMQILREARIFQHKNCCIFKSFIMINLCLILLPFFFIFYVLCSNKQKTKIVQVKVTILQYFIHPFPFTVINSPWDISRHAVGNK